MGDDHCPICLDALAEGGVWTAACGHAAHAACLTRAVAAGNLCCCLCKDPLTRPNELRALVRAQQEAHGMEASNFSKPVPAIEWLDAGTTSLPFDPPATTDPRLAECTARLFALALEGTGINTAEFMTALSSCDGIVSGSAALWTLMVQASLAPECRVPGLRLPVFSRTSTAAYGWTEHRPAEPRLAPTWEPGGIDVIIPGAHDLDRRHAAFTAFREVCYINMEPFELGSAQSRSWRTASNGFAEI